MMSFWSRWKRRRAPALPPVAKLVVGLGNPGPEYAASRHNVGVRVVERFAARHGWAVAETRFDSRFGAGTLAGPGDADSARASLTIGALLPQTYMNRSGQAVQAALRALPLHDPSEDLFLVYDDLDLPFGRLRLRPSGGAGGHRGLVDIFERLGRQDLPRLRFGIGRPPADTPTVDHVLGSFTDSEETELVHRLDDAAEALTHALLEGTTKAMNTFNRAAARDET